MRINHYRSFGPNWENRRPQMPGQPQPAAEQTDATSGSDALELSDGITSGTPTYGPRRNDFSPTARSIYGDLARQLPPDPPDFQSMLTRLDTDDSGGLSLSEFQAGAPDAATDSSSADRASQFFQKLDQDGDGKLSVEELKSAFDGTTA